jgi:hypothetical protein
MGWRLGIRAQKRPHFVNEELPRKNARRLVGERKVLSVLGGVLVLAAFLALVFAVWQKANAPIGTGDYEGTIVDRWADHSGSEQGAQRLRLVVESQDGKRFTVKVDPNVYESARVGMRIKSRDGQIVLIDSERSSNQR